MKQLLTDVALFHAATDTPVLIKPDKPGYDRRRLRISLIDEEVNNELIPAINHGADLEKIADALVDSIYVIVGTALEFGIPLDRVWAEVQRANMTKIDPATGKVRKRGDGKVLKPEGWQPPNIKACLCHE
jgi:predicted HAD superfamily Cof-like phosphohydrolase